MEWQPASRRAAADLWPRPTLGVAMLRGLKNRCPVCGVGKLFRGFLRVVDHCANCNAPLGRIRADDAPPYFTIFLVGHIVVPLMLWTDRAYEPDLWTMAAIFVPFSGTLAIGLIRPVKGATVGLMMRLGISGSDRDPLEG
jgi:uncharacterized protein (DUF983 family)